MDEKSGNEKMVAFSLGGLLGLLTEAFALFVRYIRRSSLQLKEDHPQTSVGQPASAFDTGELTGRVQAGGKPPSAVRTNPASSGSEPGKSPGARTTAASSTGVVTGEVDTVGGPRWSTPTKYIMGVSLFLVALVVLIIGRAIIPIVIFAALLALFINPFIQWINRRLHLKWSLAVGVTYVLVILVLLLIPVLVFPNLLVALNYLFALDYQELINQAIQVIHTFADSLRGNPALSTLLAPLLDSLVKALQNVGVPGQILPADTEVTLISLSRLLASRLGVLVDLLGPVVAVVTSAIFTLIIALQMSLASNQISGWYPDLIPPAYEGEYSSLSRKIVKTWISFLRGQITLMLIIGVATWLGNQILGVPFALLLGIIAGLFELIPNIGPTLAAIPAVLLALIFGSTYLPIDNLLLAVLVIAFYVLIQLLENQFIVPYVMGDAVDLPPLIILIGTLAGATAFGILGALLAAPVIATGNLVFRFIYRKILEPPPIPPSLEEKPSIWESIKGWARRIPLLKSKKETAGSIGSS